MANFSDILDKPADEVERPKPIPAGTYVAVVQGPPRQDKSQKKGTPFVEFTMKFMQAGEDVDQDALNEWAKKKDGSTRVLTDATMRNTYYLTDDSLFRLTDFLKHLGCEVEGKSIRQLLDETPGRQCMLSVTHKPTDDGEGVFANITKTAPLEG